MRQKTGMCLTDPDPDPDLNPDPTSNPTLDPKPNPKAEPNPTPNPEPDKENSYKKVMQIMKGRANFFKQESFLG